MGRFCATSSSLPVLLATDARSRILPGHTRAHAQVTGVRSAAMTRALARSSAHILGGRRGGTSR